MALRIKSPELERRLRADAARRGVSAEQYLRDLVESSLPPEASAPTEETDRPLHEAADVQEWLGAFDAWIGSHPRRDPLPENAFERASFYQEGR